MQSSSWILEAFEMVLMAFRTGGKHPCQRQAGMREMVTFVIVDVRVEVLLTRIKAL